MDVSVVIPIYQRQRDGERALRSVLRQGSLVREVILVDDASPDPFVVPEPMASDPRVRLIRHEHNRGESGARNTGIGNARSAWIAFLDSDDFWLDGKLAAQVTFAKRHQAETENPFVLYATGFVRRKAAGAKVEALFPVASERTADFASACWFMPGSTILFHRSLAEAAGPWDEKLRRSNDLDWYLSAALAGGRLAVAPVVGAVIDVGARPRPELVATACEQLTDKWIGDRAPRHLPKEMRRNLMAYLDVERAAASYAAGAYPAMAGHLARSLVRKPRLRVHLRSWWRPATAHQLPGDLQAQLDRVA